MNIGLRIRQGRRMLGLSYRALAEKTGGQISHTAISKYEKGQMVPGSVALLALARALDQPIDFFFRPERASFVQPLRFRCQAGLSKSEQQGIAEYAVDFFERYYEIEDISDSRMDFVQPLPDDPVSNPDEAMRMAKALRREWELGCDPLPNVHELMELKGIKVCEAPTDNTQFNGLCSRTQRGPVVVLGSWLNQNLLRKRMTEVHELAHIVLRVPADLSKKDEEKLVWSFAGELFLPEEAFRDAFGENRTSLAIAELIELKQLFGASIMAIVYRAKTLGLIDDALFQAFWKYVSANHWRKNGEPEDDRYEGNESHSRFRQLVLKAVAEDKISMSKGAAFLHMDLDQFRRELGDTIRG